MKRNNRYKDVHNQCLDLIRLLPSGAELPTESSLSASLQASRTTIRAVLSHLVEIELLDWQGRKKTILRKPLKRDYFVSEETRSTHQIVEHAFMENILGGHLDVGALLNESELARQFDVSTSAVREFLIRFSRFGLIEKAPNRGWILKGFTRQFALELSDVREMFEQRSVRLFVHLPPDNEIWLELTRLQQQHVDLQTRIKQDYLQFSKLDNRFHRLLNSASENRFIDDFHDLITIIFHYHYRWNKKDELERNTAAVAQHLDIIEALIDRDECRAVTACQVHLAQARETLLRSIDWDG
ncbi:GntR family transcriptional regulator [Granulosicoccus sp. 3-233]|uniref:GntR family transcriptional regulator n=1 Tax=Granulosicoccus sp. 3-233 TaxID=3417969 RepID=UPI003D33AD74